MDVFTCKPGGKGISHKGIPHWMPRNAPCLRAGPASFWPVLSHLYLTFLPISAGHLNKSASLFTIHDFNPFRDWPANKSPAPRVWHLYHRVACLTTRIMPYIWKSVLTVVVCNKHSGFSWMGCICSSCCGILLSSYYLLYSHIQPWQFCLSVHSFISLTRKNTTINS